MSVVASLTHNAPRSYSARICAHSDGDRGDLARDAFSPPSPFFSRKRRRRDRSVDVIALSPIGVRAIDALRAVASRHELSHTAVAKKAKAQDWHRPPPEDDGLKLLHIDDLKVLEIDDLKVPEIDDLLPGSSLTADR